MSIGLGEAKEGDIEAAAIVEVELARLVDDRLRIAGGAEIQPAGWNAADDAGLCRHGHEIKNALFGRDRRDTFRHAYAEVDHRVGRQFHRRPAGDDLALGHRHAGNRRQRHANLAGKGRVVLLDEGLHVVLGLLGNHDTIDQNAGDLDLS